MAPAPSCVWLERDAEGRPRCEHGWAHSKGVYWRCPKKSYEAWLRWSHTDRGREVRARHNADPAAQSRKALYELTRVRHT